MKTNSTAQQACQNITTQHNCPCASAVTSARCMSAKGKAHLPAAGLPGPTVVLAEFGKAPRKRQQDLLLCSCTTNPSVRLAWCAWRSWNGWCLQQTGLPVNPAGPGLTKTGGAEDEPQHALRTAACMAPLLRHGSTTSGVVPYVICHMPYIYRQARERLDVHVKDLAHLPGELCSLNGAMPHRRLFAIMYHQPLLLLARSMAAPWKTARCGSVVQLTD
jgi:hypothetical protein